MVSEQHVEGNTAVPGLGRACKVTSLLACGTLALTSSISSVYVRMHVYTHTRTHAYVQWNPGSLVQVAEGSSSLSVPVLQTVQTPAAVIAPDVPQHFPGYEHFAPLPRTGKSSGEGPRAPPGSYSLLWEKAKAGRDPCPQSTQLRGEVIVFIYDSDLAELRPGGWEKLEGEREEQNLNRWMEPVREDNPCPLPRLGFMPSR